VLKEYEQKKIELKIKGDKDDEVQRI